MLENVELLARIQFAGTIMFHYLFPPLSIGLGWLLFIMEIQFHRTGDHMYEEMARFWTKIFAVNFALGVATGIVMEFQFGTNWAAYSRFVGDVFGSALAAEGIFAFFLESGFLAVLVFGWDKVSPRMHLIATGLVAFGATFSAVWIIVANSWQQTPTGHHIVEHNGQLRAEIVDFWQVVFNPSTLHRLNHVLLGAFILAGFFVMSICAWYMLKGKHADFTRRCAPIALWTALIASVLILVSGHGQGRMVAHEQPAKLAALEGHFKQTEGGAPLYLFGWPNEVDERVDYGIAIPGGLSFLVHDAWDTPIPALEEFPKDERPPVLVPFISYHMMIAIGMGCIALSIIGIYYHRKQRLAQTRWLLWVFVFAVIGPYLANQAGWVAAEVGRQPWVVYGLMKTSDGISGAVSGGQIMGSIVMFSIIYLLLLFVFLYVMNDKIQHGPDYAGIEHTGVRTAPDDKGFIGAASLRTDPGGESMTEAHEDWPEVDDQRPERPDEEKE